MNSLNCPHCGAPVRVGALACDVCHKLLVFDGRTVKLAEEELRKREKQSGEVTVGSQRKIIFDINSKLLELPSGEQYVVGRRYGNDAAQPDVDLTAFDAENFGVSRLHARLVRRGDLLYITDLGSTNGTALNGRKLIPNGERLLRDGDELHLGRMRVRVRF